MLNLFNVKIADRIIDCLSGGGSESRAKKAVMAFRRHPTTEAADAALAHINALDENVQIGFVRANRLEPGCGIS